MHPCLFCLPAVHPPALIALRAFRASTSLRAFAGAHAPVLIVATLTSPTIMCASTFRDELDAHLRKCSGRTCICRSTRQILLVRISTSSTSMMFFSESVATKEVAYDDV